MKQENGFTLVELMIVIVISSLVLMIGVPSFRDTIQNNRITTQANELVTAFNFARSEAIKRGASVSVCPSTDQATCSGANDWATGWIVLLDDNDTGAPSVNQVLRAWGGLKGNPALSEDAGDTHVRYLSTGRVEDARDFTHTIPHCTGDRARNIGINASGRPQVTRAACS